MNSPAATCIQRKPTQSCSPLKGCRVARVSITTGRCNTPSEQPRALANRATYSDGSGFYGPAGFHRLARGMEIRVNGVPLLPTRCGVRARGAHVSLPPCWAGARSTDAVEWDDARIARLRWSGSRRKDSLTREQETPELIVRVMVKEAVPATRPVHRHKPLKWFGCANRLSDSHVEWPVIDKAIAASERMAENPKQSESGDLAVWSFHHCRLPADIHAGQLIRRNDAAPDFDSITNIFAGNVAGYSRYDVAPGISAPPPGTRGRFRRVCT